MPAKCSIDPAPDVPYDASFGLALHHWMKSASVLTSRGTSGPTLSTNGKRAHRGDGDEVLHRVVAEWLIEVWVKHDHGRGAEQQDRPVGCARLGGLHRDAAPCSRPIVDDDGRGVCPHLIDQQPRRDVGRSAGREAHDHARELADHLAVRPPWGCDRSAGDRSGGDEPATAEHDLLRALLAPRG